MFDKKGINKNKVGLIFAGGIVVVIALVFLIPGLLGRILPPELMARLQDISFSTGTVVERFVFYSDGMKLIMQNPIFGNGGGAWEVANFKYQSYLYYSTMPHSFFIKVWIESGILGMLSIVGIIIFFIWLSIINLIRMGKEFNMLSEKSKRIEKTEMDEEKTSQGDKESELSKNYILQFGVLSAGLALVLHSFIDFNFSLSSVLIIFIALLGITSTYTKPLKSFVLNKMIFVPVTCFIIFFSIAFGMGIYYSDKAVDYFNESNYLEAANYYKKAIGVDGLDTNYKIDYATSVVNRYLTNTDEKMTAESVDDTLFNVEQAIKANPNEPSLHQKAISIYSSLGKYDDALNQAEKWIECQPLIATNYTAVSNFYKDLATQYVAQGKVASMNNLIPKVKKLGAMIDKLDQRNQDPGSIEEAKNNIEQVEIFLDSIVKNQ